MVRASALQSLDLWLNLLVESYQKIKKIVFTAFLLGAWHLGEVVDNKSASFLVESFGKALNGTSLLYMEDRWPCFPSEERVGGRKGIRP